jgi:hypothetical protein
MGWLVLVLLVLAVLCALAFLMARHMAPVTTGLASPPPAVPSVLPAPREDPYVVLVRMVLGDRAKADRLIAFEAERAPEASRSQCIDSAVERLRRDRRRQARGAPEASGPDP